MPNLISKITICPSRKINLGNYETADLSAGIEMTLDPPIDSTDRKALVKAQEEAREIVRAEMAQQYQVYRKLLNNKTKGQ